MKSLVGLAILASVMAIAGAVQARPPAFDADEARQSPTGANAAAAGADAAAKSNKPGDSADAVYAWNAIAYDTLNGLPGPAGGAPPAAQVSMGMVAGAVYDAVNAITPKHFRPYLLDRRFGNTASTDAAVTTAAYDVLANIVSTAPNLSATARDAALQSLAASRDHWLGNVDEGPFKRQGVAAGDAAAEAMIAARQGDGRFGPSQWVPNPTPGHWSPLLDASGNPLLDPTPWVGGVKPFVTESVSQFRPPDPLPITSHAYAVEVNEVKAIGKNTSATRTTTQTYIARWWQSNPMISWNDVGTQLAKAAGFDALNAARLFAMQNLAGADAAINGWNAKYHFDYWRPWNAIRRAGEDNNPETIADDPTWTPLISAPYPEYVSGHLSLDGAHVAVLRMFFPDAPTGGFSITSRSAFILPTDAKTRTLSSFSGTLAEIIEARIWAGLHFRTADVQAEIMARHIAEYMAAHYFAAVGNH